MLAGRPRLAVLVGGRRGRLGRRRGRGVQVAAAAEHHALRGRAAVADEATSAARKPRAARVGGARGAGARGGDRPRHRGGRQAREVLAGLGARGVRNHPLGRCERVGVGVDLVVAVLELEHQQQAGPSGRRRVRVAQVRPANTRMRAAGVGVFSDVDGRQIRNIKAPVAGALCGDVDEGLVVTAQDGGRHHAVDGEQVLEAVARGVDLVTERQPPRLHRLVPAAVLRHRHHGGAGVLPLDTVAPRREAHALELGTLAHTRGEVADEVSVREPQPFGLEDGRANRGLLTLRHGVRSGQQVPELCVHRGGPRRHGGVAGHGVARAGGVRGVLALVPHVPRPHAMHEGTRPRLYSRPSSPQHVGEGEHVGVVLGGAIVLREGREARAEALHAVAALCRLDEGREQVMRDEGVAGVASGGGVVREGHAHPRVVPRVHRAVRHPRALVLARQRLLLCVAGCEQRE
mmetsp:Transcript_13295/g.31450  ORF Transcript_13295/g.31450 Transcript_13295/m.31450 type:complete len:460 (-) Transcript_13295:699-2078(-)